MLPLLSGGDRLGGVVEQLQPYLFEYLFVLFAAYAGGVAHTALQQCCAHCVLNDDYSELPPCAIMVGGVKYWE